MADSRLRELERRWRNSGRVDDEVAYLHESIRVGDLDQERLALAAYLGHPAARTVLGDGAPIANETLRIWVRGLSQWGTECLVRAALSSAQSIINIWAEKYPEDLHPQQALEAVINWIINPCDQTTAVVAAVSRDAAEAAVCSDAVYDADAADAVRAVYAALGAANAPHFSASAVDAWYSVSADAAATNAANAAVHAANAAYTAAGQPVASTPIVGPAISNDLIPWALGYRDPVREQFDALQAKANQ